MRFIIHAFVEVASAYMGLSSCASVGLGFVLRTPRTMIAGMKPQCTTGCSVKLKLAKSLENRGRSVYPFHTQLTQYFERVWSLLAASTLSFAPCYLTFA